MILFRDEGNTLYENDLVAKGLGFSYKTIALCIFNKF
jgi:hypothetical protein